MATIIDSFMISLGLDSTEFNKGVDEASTKTESFASKLTKRTAAAGAAFLSFGAVVAQVKMLAQSADQVGKAADRMGVAAPDLYAWGNAASLSGGSVSGLFNSVEQLNKQLSRIAVTGTSRLLPFFQKMGVAATDETGKVRNVFDVLRDIAGAIEGMDRMESQGLLASLQLDAGTIGLLQGGRQALDDLIKRQKELGYFTKEDTVIAAKFNDAVEELGRSFRFIFLPVLREAAPVLTSLANTMTDAFAYMQKHSAVLTAALYIMAGVVTAIVLPSLWALFAAIMANPITWVVMLIAALILVLEDLWVYANGGKSAFADFWATMGSGDEVLAMLTGAWELLKQAGQIAWDVLKFAMLSVLVTFYKISTAIAALFGLSAWAFKGIGAFIDNHLVNPLKDVWDWITRILDKLPSLSGIKATVSERWEQATTPIVPSLSAIAAGGTTNTQQEINVNKIDIHTAATDPNGIAVGIGGAIRDNADLFFVNASGQK